jgi:hypothetical protein
MITRISDDQLDAAVNRLLLGEYTADVVAFYPGAEDDLGPLLDAAVMLEAAHPVEFPAAGSLVTDRNSFLAELTAFQLQSVSSGPIVRLREWLSQQISGFSKTPIQQPKEIRKMTTLLLKVVLLLAIAFGSLGGTLAATADSLPDSAVYPLKLAIEQAQLTFKNDSVDQAEMHLAFAQERAREMTRLAAKGEIPEEASLTRMQTHLRTAYQLAALADDVQMQGLLTQARIMTQANGQELADAQEQVQARVKERLQLASHMMFQWQHEAKSGLQDPGRFRWQYGPGGPCADDTCQPSTGSREQGQHQHGPGSPLCEGADCQPPFGDGNQEQHQYGPDGPCEDDDCQPPFGSDEQEQHRYGPGGPSCEGADCQPPFGSGEQEQHRYGAGDPPCNGDDCQPPFGNGEQEQHRYGEGDPLCNGDDCQPSFDTGNQEQHQSGPGDQVCAGDGCDLSNGDGNQQQYQNTEQNQGQGDTQDQNQEQNNHVPNGQQSSGNDNSSGSSDSGSSENPADPNDSGSVDNSGGSGSSDDSGGPSSSGDSGSSGSSSSPGGSSDSGSGRGG